MRMSLIVLFAVLCLLNGAAWSQPASTALSQEAQRSKLGRVGLEFIEREAGGRDFLAMCSKSAVSDAAALTNFGVDSGLPSDVIGGHCSCVAGLLFVSPQSQFYGRMQSIVRLAGSVSTGSVVLAAVEDAKSRGGEAQGAMAVGFVQRAVDICKDAHLDLKARAAAERAANLESIRKALVEQQQLPARYIAEVEKVAVRHGGATVVGCSTADEWPEVSDLIFIINQARGEGDWFSGWLNQQVFDRFLSAAVKQPEDAIREALPKFRQAAENANQEAPPAFPDPALLGREGDFYRMPLIDARKEIGYFCIARTEAGKSYYAAYPPGGKALAKVDSFLNALSGGEEIPTTECTADASSRMLRENGGFFLDQCRVVARGSDAGDSIRAALLDSAKRELAVPALLEQLLESRAAEREASRRF